MNYWNNQNIHSQRTSAESNLLNSALGGIYGFYMIQLGGERLEDLKILSPIPHKFHVNHDVRCKFTELPFLPNSVDLFVLPHTLELVSEPYKVLNEIYHILGPEGRVVIIGFNPHSLWGIAKVCSKGSYFPKHKKWYSSRLVCNWLRGLQFNVLNCQTTLFRPPLKSKKTQKKMLFLEGIGQMLFPYFGGVYMIVAKKTVLTGIPVRKKTAKLRTLITRPSIGSTARNL